MCFNTFSVPISNNDQTYFLSISLDSTTLVLNINQKPSSSSSSSSLAMRSFLFGLLSLLILSYWAHLFVTSKFDSNDLGTMVIDKRSISTGICECRCCLLHGAVCESTIRYELSFKNDFSCDQCTNEFCTLNTNQTLACETMYSMKANCFYYTPREKASAFVSIRPILQ
ncbi:hypothetical protein I4U23_026104 [Adineta vaga]|nr:hypothetical protein I4U23_026104 [Adineta vaga]